MPTYNLTNFKDSLQSVDKEVKQLYSAYSKKSIWHDEGKRKFEISKNTLTKLEQKIDIININGIEYYHISREQIIELLPKNNSKEQIFLFYLAIIIWGYPSGGRGESVVNILHNREKIFEQFRFIKSKSKNYDFNEIFTELNGTKKLSGMGPSTFTKILHFMDFENESGKKAMIFDLQIIDILNRKNIKEVNNFMQNNKVKMQGNGELNFRQNAEHYKLYCNLIHELASKMSVSPEATEIFLFQVFKSI